MTKKLILLTFIFIPYMSNSQTIQAYYALFKHSFYKPLEDAPGNKETVDEKNAFIQIIHPQKPTDAVSFKSFAKEDGSLIFGFQYADIQEGLGLVLSRTEFYTFQDNQWQDVSNEVCPVLVFQDFWGDQALPNQFLQEYNLELVLPQIGTTLVAKSKPAIAVQFPYGNLPKGYSETFEQRKFKNIELNWNKSTGKFELGKKY